MSNTKEKIQLEKEKLEHNKGFVSNLTRFTAYSISYVLFPPELKFLLYAWSVFVGVSLFWLLIEYFDGINYRKFPMLRYVPATGDLLFAFLFLYLTGGLNSLVLSGIIVIISVSTLFSNESHQVYYSLGISSFTYLLLAVLLYFQQIPHVNVFAFSKDTPLEKYLFSVFWFHIIVFGNFFAIRSIIKKNQEQSIRIEEIAEEAEREKQKAIEAKREVEVLAESRKRLALVGQLSAGIVHDIKNPMATIKYLAEKANTASISSEKREKNLNLIVQEMDRLNNLAYEILDFSKGEIQLQLEEVNLGEFLVEIEKFLQTDFAYSEIQYRQDLKYDGNIQIDRDRMRRVIINLAKNAIEAMHDGRKEYCFTIRAEKISASETPFLKGGKGGLQICLQDNGPGLPDGVEAKIFEAFATEGKTKGTGLGLFMSKWIVEAHNGSLTYETEREIGTTFIITIPIKQGINIKEKI